MTTRNRWFVHSHRSGGANAPLRARLLCFPHAGASASAYRAWTDQVPPWLDVWSLQLPGRGARFTEPAFERLLPLVASIADAFGKSDDLPFAFFGHSMGALLAFETARRLRAEKRDCPVA